MRLLLTLTIILAFCRPVGTIAQKSPPPTAPISAAQVLEKHFAAVGGLENLRALQTFDAHGVMGPPGSTNNLYIWADFNFYYRAPAIDVFQLQVKSEGLAWCGHNQGKPFVQQAGQYRLGGVNAASLPVLEQSWLGLIDSDFDQSYKKVQLVGLSGVSGNWAYVLMFTPKAGDPQVRYYDCKNFLMVRMDFIQRFQEVKNGPSYMYKIETDYSDYQVFDGISLPRRIEAIASFAGGNWQTELQVEKMHTNAPISDSVFHPE